VTVSGHSQISEQVLDTLVFACLRPPLNTAVPRMFKAVLRDVASGARPDGFAAELADRLNIPRAERQAVLTMARERAAGALERAAKAGLRPLCYSDLEYPALLWTIIDPPIVLWLKGDASVLTSPIVSIVGARTATPAALSVARRLASELVDSGLTIASGLARGVDAAAHAGALDAGGRTIAVLGCGADVVYPREHEGLAGRIQESGGICSEFLPGVEPFPAHFPMRNRIISGLSRAVVVIEASDQSGSLITARAALEQGRDVLAVPGSVVSGRYRGSHALIKDGARLVETVEDVLQEIGWSRRVSDVGHSDKHRAVSELEETMAAGETYQLDDLASSLGREASVLLAELSKLEVAGRVRRMAGGGFARLDEPVIGSTRRKR
jgi:DNA processing protein